MDGRADDAASSDDAVAVAVGVSGSSASLGVSANGLNHEDMEERKGDQHDD